MTHPKTVTHRNTNRTRRTVTSFMRRTTLTMMPRHQHTVIIRKMPSIQDRRQTVRVTTPARPHAFALRRCRMPLLCHAACLAALACICGRNGNLLLHPSINTYRGHHILTFDLDLHPLHFKSSASIQMQKMTALYGPVCAWCFLFVPLHFGTAYRHFFTARCYASAVLAMGLCPCLCLSVSVTSRSSTKTAKRRITQTTPRDSPGTLVF